MSEIRIRVYKKFGMWQVHQTCNPRPSVQTMTWPQAMDQASKYARVPERHYRRERRRADRAHRTLPGWGSNG